MLGSTRIFSIALVILLLGSAVWAGEVVVPFVSGEATITKNTHGMTSFSVPDMASITSPGDPALPFAFKYVLLPPDVDVSSLRVEIRDGVEKRMSGSFTVMPSGPAVSTGDERKEYWGHNKAIFNGFNLDVYAEKKFYPADYANAEPISQLGPYVMVPVKFWPYKYNPSTGEVRHLAKGNVAVIYDSKPGVSAASLPPTQPAFDQIVAEVAINASQASEWYAGTASVLSASTSILVLTTQDIVNNSTQLANWVSHKEGQGWTVDVVTNTAAWGGGTGQPVTAGIYNYLQAVYTNYRYVVFIGNSHPLLGELPMAYLHPFGPTGGEYPSDLWYADRTGNWDLNGNGAFGECVYYPDGDFGTGGVDYNVELITGRIPYYGSMTDLDHILAKLIAYDDATTVPGKMQRVLFSAKPSDAATPGYQLGEAIRTDICNAPRGREHFRIYEDTYSLMPPPDSTPTASIPLIDAMNAGAGLLVWWAHGNVTYADCILDVANCIPLLNDVSMVPMTFQASCRNAWPEDSGNLAYHLLIRGAINTIAGTRDTWYYSGETTFTNSDSNAGLGYRYAYNLARNFNRTGDALMNAILVTPNVTPANHYDFTLHGDPTMVLRWPTSFQMQSTSPLTTATRNVFYRKDLFASGGTMPYTWTRTSGTLPTGITLNSAGYLSGTPTTVQTRTFTLRCTKSGGGYVSRSFTLSVTN